MSKQEPTTTDVDAERMVISYLLAADDGRDAVDQLMTSLREEDFSAVDLRTVFHGIHHAWAQGTALSTASVSDSLHELGFPRPKHADLVRLTLEHPSSHASAISAHKRIRDLGRWRELMGIGEMVRGAFARGGLSVGAVALQAQKLLDEIGSDDGSSVQSMAEILRARVGELAQSGKQEPTRRVLTGFAPLDGMVGGFGESDLVVLAASTGGGKSAMASHVAEGVASTGRNVLMASAEMQGWELGDRFLSSSVRVPITDIRDGRLDLVDIQNLKRGAQHDRWSRIFVLERTGTLTVQRIAAVARMLHRQAGLGLVVVDYLQLIAAVLAPGERGRTREAEVAAVTRGLKNLAMDLQTPVLALSQFNRKADYDGEPELWHLRESGEIEQAANMVLFLWRKEGDGEGVRRLVCKKHRSGPADTSIRLGWEGKTVSFRGEIK